MKIDLNKREFVTEQIYDICICGAGAAGITLATELAAKGKKVALFEGGGKEYSDESRSVYGAKSTGLTYYGSNGCRLRYLGGTTNHWAGRTMELQPIDFVKRDFLPLAGWPIEKKDLDKHRKRAFEILELKKDSLKSPVIPQLSTSSMKMLGHGSSPPVRFGKKYYKELVSSKNIDLFINANLTNLKLNDKHNSVRQIEIKNYKGNTFSFSGGKIILAMGAIENARLLLNCDSQIPGGIGNHSDFVGRCFMEHFQVFLGEYSINPDSSIWKNGINLEFFPTDKLVKKEKIGTSVISFGRADARAYGRLKAIKKVLKDNVCHSDSLTTISKSLFDFNCEGDGVITTLCEQSPNKNSRITLRNEKDSLGLRRVSLDWQINELDKRTIRTIGLESAKEFARLDIGRVKLKDYVLSNDIEEKLGAHCHQLGTTRMSELPKDGVVDINSKVFGIDNLYIAGGSVFSTGGGVNPTLPIVQLTLRLAAHLLADKV